jgi:hypothetical protein
MRSLKLGFLVILPVLALTAGGCDNANFNLVAMYVIAPEDDCTHVMQDTGPGSSASMLGGGLIDVGHPIYSNPDVAPNYYAWIQVHNYTLNNGDPDVGRINSRDIRLQTVELSYSWMRNEALINQPGYETLIAMEDEDVSEPIAAMVSAASSPDEPGVLVAGIGLIPRYLGGDLTLLADFAADPINLSQLVLGVSVRFVGTTLGGTRVESYPLVFPINFCVGCLSGGAMCPDGVTPLTSCIPGQDSFNEELCPAAT